MSTVEKKQNAKSKIASNILVASPDTNLKQAVEESLREFTKNSLDFQYLTHQAGSLSQVSPITQNDRIDLVLYDLGLNQSKNQIDEKREKELDALLRMPDFQSSSVLLFEPTTVRAQYNIGTRDRIVREKPVSDSIPSPLVSSEGFDKRLAVHLGNFHGRQDRLTGALLKGPLKEILQREYDQVVRDHGRGGADDTRAKNYLSLLFMDLDNMKLLNDKILGHVKTDLVLRAIGEELHSMIRYPDEIGRYGGDEFIVKFYGPHQHIDILKRAQQICAGLSSIDITNKVNAPEYISLGFSAGVATFPEPCAVDNIDALIDSADTAMYEAKRYREEKEIKGSGYGVAGYPSGSSEPRVYSVAN
ncbi:GGDEF domain-containing protein [Candidatus Woesearchaeota archaeon]|nr:GGDEF domain-containing protein [Candidatus Woesearchaeota archaeon]